jgi:hypothetical protein
LIFKRETCILVFVLATRKDADHDAEDEEVLQEEQENDETVLMEVTGKWCFNNLPSKSPSVLTMKFIAFPSDT